MCPMPSRVVSIGSGSPNDRTPMPRSASSCTRLSTSRRLRQPVQCVHDNDVPVAGVAEQLRQAWAVDGGAGLLVAVDPICRDARRSQCVELPVQALLRGRDPAVANFQSARRPPTLVVHIHVFMEESPATSA
jgi:hypothetical protein